ncbi:zinc finger CCCH domain-containing protein 5-like isoform X1 [Hibiscus syriacus]|uniref:Zinc finger CCCH domain-containing protein 5-like isoform X1 n=1 Tax=Hibiscus syriacus TaxID=106335 RepID=A0A6A3AH98_HIBSY|nr:protein EDS1-like [Hibiscus syriacus]KAE8703458.1 zinc finger CCCH domain-containing protein 5-like isoform X1 [Hibiscus syriacus]
MGSFTLGEISGISEKLIKKTCSMAMAAHKSPQNLFVVENSRTSSDVIFSFPGSWSAGHWFTRQPFGEIKVDQSDLFCPKGNDKVATSLRSIGRDELATVNEGFLRRFETILGTSSLQAEVEKAIMEKKKVVFTGHASGGAVAILATVWYLEQYLKPEKTSMPPLCVTFGSPLVGDFIFNHALTRENWSQYFLHFVMRYDIVPRILLAPLSSMGQELEQIFSLLNQKAMFPIQGTIVEASKFYETVMRNASAVASHAACRLMGNTNPILETVSSFIELSPYRPCGTFVFCSGHRKLVSVRNADAVLQLLFYSSQLRSENELKSVAERSLDDHFNYLSELLESLNKPLVQLDHLEALPLSSNGITAENIVTNMALNDLGLSARARLCLRAAGEHKKQKLSNQQRMDSKKKDIESGLRALEEYKTKSALCNVGYYEAFKISKEEDDFKANVKRLELTGIWDEIIEMLNRYELPEGFESRKDWIELAIKYRRIVEPLDIANYYRHAKNEDTGPYMHKGRPRRYKYTQRWREHALRMPVGSSAESCFWAEVEELLLYRTTNPGAFEDIRERIINLERKLEEWFRGNQISNDVFLKGSALTKWWITLPHQHKSTSRIQGLINI